MYSKIEWKGNGGRNKDRYRNNTPIYPSSIPDLTLPGRYFGLVIHCRAPLSSALGFKINALCETRWVVKSNPKGCRVPKLMESVVFQDFCIYHFLHCKMKTHQLVVTFFDEICSKKK